uniref:carbonic anhydrase n=1 Tax=Macrostomum lignano TaxID=282301 RepID=A0A1I8HD97_9PLAT
IVQSGGIKWRSKEIKSLLITGDQLASSPTMRPFLLLTALLVACVQASMAKKMCPNAVIFNSYNFPTYYLTQRGNGEMGIAIGNGTRFVERDALDGTKDGISLESLSQPGYFLCNVDNIIKLVKTDKSALFNREASFLLEKAGEGYYRFKSTTHSKHYLRHQSMKLKLMSWTDTNLFKADSSFGVVCASDKLFKLDVCDGEFHLISKNYPKYSVKAGIDVISTISTTNGTRLKFVTPALNGNPRAVSIESAEKPGHFLNTVADHFVMMTKFENTAEFRNASTFKVVIMSNGYVRLQSLRNPRHYIRHSEFKLRLERWAETKLYDQDSSWKIDCALIPCETKAFVYNPAYENARGPHCEFAPPKWWQISPFCKDLPANRPSPINIEMGLCKNKSAKVKKIGLGKGWHDERKFILQADAVNSADLTVTGGHLNGTYNCFQFHFHWGSAANVEKGIGSEHRLFDATGKALPTPMEVHIVCKRQELSMSKAINTTDAITVLGGFIHQMNPKDHDGWAGHVIAQVLSNMTELFKPVGHGAVVSAKDVETVELQLRDLLPESLHRFVNYDGAFTTPSCNPVAQWHLFTDSMKIRKELLLKFTKTFFDKAKKRPMVDNFRPVMSRHGREIRCSFSNKEASPEEVKKVASETRVVS